MPATLKTLIASSLLFTAACATVETEKMIPVGIAPNPISPGLLEESQKTVRDLMKDPESVKFRHEITYRTRHGDELICGEYDAKNSYGGYNGYTNYYFRYRDGVVLNSAVDTNGLHPMAAIAARACAEMSSGQILMPQSQLVE